MGEKKEKMGTVKKTNNLKKIYILHGWSYSTEKWEPFVNELKNQGLQVALLKIPGLTAPLEKPWTLDDYVTWLDEQTKSEKNLILLGHSNGGRISLAYSLKHPEKVKHLILLDSAGILHKEIPLRIKRALFELAAKTGKKILPKNSSKYLYKLAREKDYQEANPIQRETMKNLISVDLAPQLNELQVPTTIIWGREDRTTPFSDAEIMHEEIKNSKLFPIQNARHSPQYTHVSEVADIIKRTL